MTQQMATAMFALRTGGWQVGGDWLFSQGFLLIILGETHQGSLFKLPLG